MDGPHDLGGRMGFGPVDVEPDEPVFHHRWEARVFGTTGAVLVAGLFGGGGRFRHAIERMDPVHYLSSSYYEHWLTGAATLLVEDGVLDHAELEARAGSFPLSRPVSTDDVLLDGPPRRRFALGDRVRVRDVHPKGHTRCPDYVRGHVGEVVRVGRPEPVDDVSAHRPETVAEVGYAVRFRACDLWGERDDGGERIHVDLLDRYLEEP